MTAKPFNHVTAAQAALRLDRVSGESWPEVPEDLLAFLSASYPPRCYTAGETVEAHLLYAGAVELVAAMRAAYEDQQARAISWSEEDRED